MATLRYCALRRETVTAIVFIWPIGPLVMVRSVRRGHRLTPASTLRCCVWRNFLRLWLKMVVHTCRSLLLALWMHSRFTHTCEWRCAHMVDVRHLVRGFLARWVYTERKADSRTGVQNRRRILPDYLQYDKAIIVKRQSGWQVRLETDKTKKTHIYRPKFLIVTADHQFACPFTLLIKISK